MVGTRHGGPPRSLIDCVSRLSGVGRTYDIPPERTPAFIEKEVP